MRIHRGLRDGWRRWIVPPRSLLHHRFGEPAAEPVAADRLTAARFADVFSLAYVNTHAAPTTWPPHVESPADADAPELADTPEGASSHPPLPEPAFLRVPKQSSPEELIPEVWDSVVAEPVVAEPVVAEPVVAEPVITEPVVTEPVVTEPVVTEPVVTEPVVTERLVSEAAAPPVGRHRRPTFFERVALVSRRRLFMVGLSVLVLVATVLVGLFAMH